MSKLSKMSTVALAVAAAVALASQSYAGEEPTAADLPPSDIVAGDQDEATLAAPISADGESAVAPDAAPVQPVVGADPQAEN